MAGLRTVDRAGTVGAPVSPPNWPEGFLATVSLRHPRIDALALALLVATPCLAQTNLVTNESFDEDVVGWEPVEDFMSISFDTADVDDDEESGSARVAFNPVLGFETTGHVAQCIAVLPGQTYTGSASFLIPIEQQRNGSAALRVAWYESIDCSGPSPEFAFGNSGNLVGDWANLSPSQFVAPDDIFSAEVQLEIRKPVLGGTLVIFYDEVVSLPEPSSSLNGVAALICVGGIAKWRRRREPRR